MNTAKESHKIVKLSREGRSLREKWNLQQGLIKMEHQFWMQEVHWLGKYLHANRTKYKIGVNFTVNKKQ